MEDYDEDYDYIEDVYSKDAREHQLDDDELSTEEEAFMRGWDEAG